MRRISVQISPGLAQQIDRLLREGWYRDEQGLVEAALESFVEHRSFLGDSPRLLLGFAADALNDSKPETALRFTSRAQALLGSEPSADLEMYKAIVELRVQCLLVLGRESEARSELEAARGRLPNSPGITGWIDRLRRRPSAEAR